jgi:predicted 3-demethylubiquinone-9 3-methyltransferase (glyoxalase superfamily)
MEQNLDGKERTSIMQHITPHLWFDTQAKEAAEFYTSVMPDSQVTNITTLHDTPSGDCDIVSFEISGHPFMAISAGPLFTFNPSISFILNFDPSKDSNARAHLDRLWEQLSQGGTALMPLDTYPFSQHYGWIQDRFGLSWQLMLTNPAGEERPFVTPELMFVGENAGRAEEAIEFYSAVFKDARRGTTARYPERMEPEHAGTIMFADFSLRGSWFAAMDSAGAHHFTFNEAISLLVPCETQAEIDYYWENLSAVPEAEQCGWLKDRFGLSWQVWPTVIGDMMKHSTREQIDRITQAFLPMKKFDIATLQRAYEGK